MGEGDRASSPDAAARFKTRAPGFFIKEGVAGLRLIALRAKRANRTGHKARLFGAALARALGRWHGQHKGQSERPPKRDPKPMLSTDEPPHRAFPNPPGCKRPSVKRQKGRPIKREKGLTAKVCSQS